MPNQRLQLTDDVIEQAAAEAVKKLRFRVQQKGHGTFASNHEILGVVRQETTEYEDAIHKRMDQEAKVQELLDIAVAAIFGVASIRGGGVDW